MGGGGLKNLKKCHEYIRVGGSTQDLINYVACYQDRSNKNYVFINSINVIHRKYSSLGQKRLVLASVSKTLDNISLNFNASAGIYKQMGFTKKVTCAPILVMAYLAIFTAWCTNPDTLINVKEVWTVAGRPKLLTVDKALLNARKSLPNCRAISIASPIEQFLSFPIYHPVSKCFESFFKTNGYGIAIGVDRNSLDWKLISDNFANAKYVYGGDYSKYDTSIPRDLMIRGIDVAIDMYYNMSKHNTVAQPIRNYLKRYRQWFIDNIVDKEIIIQDVIKFKVTNGMPSGVLWTSLLNSIVNLIIIEEAMSHMKIKNFKPVVYGDDHIVIIYDDILDSENFCVNIGNFIEGNFGIKCNPDDALLTTPEYFFVGYERPVYKTGTDFSKGTRGLKPLYSEMSDTMFDQYDESKGQTHRWKYNFSKRVKFLQYYWMKSGLAIRPSIDTLNRLLNPEKKIKWITDYEAHLFAFLADNFNNAHVRSSFYIYFYDLGFLRTMFDYKRNRLMDVAFLPKVPQYFNKYYIKNTPCCNTRLWFRYQNGKHVDPYNHPSMDAFNKRFHRLQRRIFYLITSIKDIEFYKKKDLLITLYKKQITGELNSSSLLYQNNLKLYKQVKLSITEKDEITGEQSRNVALKVNSYFSKTFKDFVLPIDIIAILAQDAMIQYYVNPTVSLRKDDIRTFNIRQDHIDDLILQYRDLFRKEFVNLKCKPKFIFQYFDFIYKLCVYFIIIYPIFLL
uniref:RdRp n=1 Tax=Hubei partiti-like virus 59 TaxID=1923068 RepID=A0A1L3KLL9_9VIRU|nr:RdRp [Hubei partiti-like virus 59]